LEGEIGSKRGRPRTTIINKVINDGGLRSYRRLKILVNNREERKEYGRPTVEPTLGLITKKEEEE